jgi:hypothetical protein
VHIKPAHELACRCVLARLESDGAISVGRTPRAWLLMNVVTGRMRTNQRLIGSILTIQRDGGVRASRWRPRLAGPADGGRDERQVVELADRHGPER